MDLTAIRHKTFRITDAQNEAIARALADSDVTLSDIIRDALRDFCHERGVTWPDDVRQYGKSDGDTP